LIGELLEHLADMAVLICNGIATSQREPLVMEANWPGAPLFTGVRRRAQGRQAAVPLNQVADVLLTHQGDHSTHVFYV